MTDNHVIQHCGLKTEQFSWKQFPYLLLIGHIQQNSPLTILSCFLRPFLSETFTLLFLKSANDANSIYSTQIQSKTIIFPVQYQQKADICMKTKYFSALVYFNFYQTTIINTSVHSQQYFQSSETDKLSVYSVHKAAVMRGM